MRTAIYMVQGLMFIEPEEKDSEGKLNDYDMEPDRKDSRADKKALPRIVRFYHGNIIARCLSSGAGYDELKNAVVIMVIFMIHLAWTAWYIL